MTNDEIDAMEAGPEMDALVADRVMGWRVAEWEDGCDYAFDATGFAVKRLTGYAKKRWRPSIDMGAAWSVVEHIGLLDHAATLSHHPNEGGWWVDDNHNHAIQSVAPTAPLAICRAALRAAVLKATPPKASA